VLTAECVRGLDIDLDWKGVGDCVLTVECVRGLDIGLEWKGVGELCVDSILC